MSKIVFAYSDFMLFTTLRTISNFTTKSFSLARLKPVSIWRLPTNKIYFRYLQKALFTVTKPKQTTNQTNAAQQENLPKAWKPKPVWKPPKPRHAFPHAKRSQFELDRERSKNITRHLEGKAELLRIKRGKRLGHGISKTPAEWLKPSNHKKPLAWIILPALGRHSDWKKFWGSWRKKKINILLSQHLTVSWGSIILQQRWQNATTWINSSMHRGRKHWASLCSMDCTQTPVCHLEAIKNATEVTRTGAASLS